MPIARSIVVHKAHLVIGAVIRRMRAGVPHVRLSADIGYHSRMLVILGNRSVSYILLCLKLMFIMLISVG